MWRTAEEITQDLQSKDPERIAAGLETLEFHMDTGEVVGVPMPTAELLAPFGIELPEEVAVRFYRLLDEYESFEPEPTQEEREREAALAAARYAPSRLGLEVSLMLKTSIDPASSVRLALAAIAERGVRPEEVEHAGMFISYLLAGRDPVRAATVGALADWRGRPDLEPVIQWVSGELEPDEKARIST
jgi:hypothetical protein